MDDSEEDDIAPIFHNRYGRHIDQAVSAVMRAVYEKEAEMLRFSSREPNLLVSDRRNLHARPRP